MKPLNSQSIAKGGLTLSTRREGNDTFVKLSGNGDADTPAMLGTYLQDMHAEARRQGVERVVVECADLYFMSAACVRCLAIWIRTISKLDKGQRYKVTFSANPNLPWQRRSFDELRRHAPSLVQIVDAIAQPGASASHSVALPASGTLRQSSVSSPSGNQAHAATALPSATTPSSKDGASSGTMPHSTGGSPSATMPQTGTVPQTPAARRRR